MTETERLARRVNRSLDNMWLLFLIIPGFVFVPLFAGLVVGSLLVPLSVPLGVIAGVIAAAAALVWYVRHI